MKFLRVRAPCPNAECFSHTAILGENRTTVLKVPEGVDAVKCLHCKTTIPIPNGDE